MNVATARTRDRAIVLGGLAALTALCWAYTLGQAGHGHHGGPGLAAGALMWSVMMAAMMVPAAGARLLGLAGFAPPAMFLAGYLAVWTGFSLLAALAQWAWLPRASAAVGGVLIVVAGVYQLTPAKSACLGHCRRPMDSTPHGDGGGRAFRAGLVDGLFCVGSCWALMLPMLVGGALALPWMAAISAIVLAEKVAGHGPWLGRLAGVLLLAWGAWRVVGALA